MLYKPFNYLYRKVRTPSYMLSFPKSGRTWTRFFLAHYCSQLHQTKMHLHTGSMPHDVTPRIFLTHPRIEFKHLGQYGKRDAVRNVNKITTFARENKDKKIILLVRDPRDVVVSFYHHTRRWSEVDEIQHISISDFVRHQHFGIARIIDYLNEWHIASAGLTSFKVVHYEALRSDPYQNFAEVLKFYDIPVEPDLLEKSIQASSFDNMKVVESKNTLKDQLLQPANLNDPNSYKVRKGKVAGYVDELSVDDIEFCNLALQRLDKTYGYSN